MTLILYHLAESVALNTTWETWLRLAACVRVRVFLSRVSCVPALFVDPETCRLLYVTGGSSKAEAQSSAGVAFVAKSERQVDGVRVDSDIEALPRVRSTTGLFTMCVVPPPSGAATPRGENKETVVTQMKR